MKRGFGTVELVIAVVALGIVVAAGFAAKAYVDGVDAKAYARGVAETTTEWQERERQAQAGYDSEKAQLQEAHAAAVQGLMDQLSALDAKHQKEMADEKLKNDRTAADLRAGRIVFHDPGQRAAPNQGCAGGPNAGAAPISGGNAAPAGDLSGESAEFLWGEAGRADEVAEQLALAQDNVTAYYLLAKQCYAARGVP